ncbi:MAG: aldose epimerase family protein [Candidatus Ornithospirochaeta sp.]
MKTIRLENGRYSAEILDQGAILYSYSVDGHDVVLGFEDKEDNVASSSFFGQVVGPFANRIKDARYSDEYGEHVLEKNNGKNHLHSGKRNYGFQKWDIEETTPSSVTLSLFSPEGHGFPGDQKARVKYTLSSDGRLKLEYRVEGDKKCPVNPTNHAFFSLRGWGDVRDSIVTIPAESYVEVDEGLIPTSVIETEGTDYDFRTPHRMGERRDGAYDNCFILDEGGVVRVENEEYALEMTTSLPAVQFYTSGHLNRTERGKGGMALVPYTGFCLESEYYPDFPNRPDFPGFYVGKGKVYESWTEYRLIKK